MGKKSFAFQADNKNKCKKMMKIEKHHMITIIGWLIKSGVVNELY